MNSEYRIELGKLDRLIDNIQFKYRDTGDRQYLDMLQRLQGRRKLVRDKIQWQVRNSRFL